jgi:hypothetical protein
MLRARYLPNYLDHNSENSSHKSRSSKISPSRSLATCFTHVPCPEHFASSALAKQLAQHFAGEQGSLQAAADGMAMKAALPSILLLVTLLHAQAAK